MALVEGLPKVGALSLVGLFFLALITLIKVWPLVQKNLLDAKEARAGKYETRIATLEQAVVECHEEWSAKARVLEEKSRMLETKILDLQRQHVQEQISLINTIINSVDAPELKKLLNMLETVQRALNPTSGITSDA